MRLFQTMQDLVGNRNKHDTVLPTIPDCGPDNFFKKDFHLWMEGRVLTSLSMMFSDDWRMSSYVPTYYAIDDEEGRRNASLVVQATARTARQRECLCHHQHRLSERNLPLVADEAEEAAELLSLPWSSARDSPGKMRGKIKSWWRIIILQSASHAI